MLFNSIEFQLFFPIVIILYFLIPMRFVRIKQVWLLVVSYYFYMSWNAKYVVLIATSTVITYICGLFLENINNKELTEKEKTNYKKLVIAAGFVINLGILFYFKYTNFFLGIAGDILNGAGIGISVPKFDILLPVGISFYTLQALGYIMDVYRGEVKAQRNIIQYALFVSFFPQLVAGPIERTKNLMGQLQVSHAFKFENLREGVLLMSWGYFLKIVIADRIALYVDTIYGDLGTYGGVYFILAFILFAFQLYCDFYGYSVIAKGSAKVLGIDLMENFKAPFLSENTAVLWRNWHISLSSWFKDYLYIPLGGNRKGKVRKYFNLMVVNMVSGLWHGANITYVIWGTLNGLFNVMGGVTLQARTRIAKALRVNTSSFIHRVLKIGVTFFLFAFSFIFFRAESISQALEGIKSIFTKFNLAVLTDGSIYNCGLDKMNFIFMILCLMVLIAVDICNKNNIYLRQYILKQVMPVRILIFTVTILFILVFGMYGPQFDKANFIYFQF